jgi:hypothetical protein
MLGAVIVPAVEGFRGIQAQSIQFENSRELIPELFNPDCTVQITLCHKIWRALSASSNAGMRTGFIRHSVDHRTDSLEESHRVRHLVNHELRQYFSDIQRHKVAFFNRDIDG